MAIPESQLETWSRQGATKIAAATRESIYNTLYSQMPELRSAQYDVYLQGSYRNDTNIRADSDVDVVVQLNTTFSSNKTELPSDQLFLHDQTYPPAAYTWEEFRLDVLAALRNRYGVTKVTEGSKCLKVAGDGTNRLPADVVVALEHREYDWFYSSANEKHAEGIAFYTRPDRRRVINFPKPHYDNGCAKNDMGRTGGQFKPVVRMFKNMRNRMIAEGYLPNGAAPSYFLQCLLYNMPDSEFSSNLGLTLLNVLLWYHGVSVDALICQNGVVPLFGPTPEQWSEQEATRFLRSVGRYWQDWA